MLIYSDTSEDIIKEATSLDTDLIVMLYQDLYDTMDGHLQYFLKVKNYEGVDEEYTDFYPATLFNIMADIGEKLRCAKEAHAEMIGE